MKLLTRSVIFIVLGYAIKEIYSTFRDKPTTETITNEDSRTGKIANTAGKIVENGITNILNRAKTYTKK
jgi:hypothetical protein